MVRFIFTENKSKRDLIRMLVQKGFESDPVVAWNKAQEKVRTLRQMLQTSHSIYIQQIIFR